jgi:hypothetical protein
MGKMGVIYLIKGISLDYLNGYPASYSIINSHTGQAEGLPRQHLTPLYLLWLSGSTGVVVLAGSVPERQRVLPDR